MHMYVVTASLTPPYRTGFHVSSLSSPGALPCDCSFPSAHSSAQPLLWRAALPDSALVQWRTEREKQGGEGRGGEGNRGKGRRGDEVVTG